MAGEKHSNDTWKILGHIFGTLPRKARLERIGRRPENASQVIALASAGKAAPGYLVENCRYFGFIHDDYSKENHLSLTRAAAWTIL
jgi:hypothetical protein